MEGDRGGPSRDGWTGLRAIATLRGLNARCLALLAETALEQTATHYSGFYRELTLWRKVDSRSCERAGCCPVLLLNLNFENPTWWRRVCGGPSGAPRPFGGFDLAQEERARALLREILMEVWRLGRELPSAANLLFGMASGVSVEISNLSVSDIDWIAADYARDLRPRWQENGVFWKNLLEAVIGPDDEALVTVALHCMQLLGSEL